VYIEALDVYYRKCIFKLDGLLDPANVWPLWQIEEVLGGSELGRITLMNMRKVELNLFWHRLPDASIERAEGEAGNYEKLAEFEGDKRAERLERAVQVLRQAGQLTSVILTWKEIPTRPGEESQSDLRMKEKVLQSLGALTRTRLTSGDIVASDAVEATILGQLHNLNRSMTKSKHNRVRSRAYVRTAMQKQIRFKTDHIMQMELVEATEHGTKKANNIESKRLSYFG
jgi:hypothetical protein